MKRRPVFAVISILAGLLCFAACGSSGGRVVYQYSETEVLMDGSHIQKTVYAPGEMKLYYRGMDLDESQIKCYDADFMELDGEFAHTFKNGVLTIKADFAEQISGLMIDDSVHDTIYRLRYLDSPQFAWLADTLWYDYGWMELGDAERYYSEAELQTQADKANEERQETLDLFALLEGTWVSEDGLQKYEFAVNVDKSGMECCNMWWNSDAQRWDCWSIFAKSAYQTKGLDALFAFDFGRDEDSDYDEIAEKAEKLIAITLVNSDHAAADLRVLYDSEENVIKDTDVIYHKQRACGTYPE